MPIQPIVFSTLACLLWSFIFVAPLLLNNICCFDVVLGRFFFYGITSLCVALITFLIKGKKICFKYWKEAALCALIMNILYYIFLTEGMRLASPSVISLILGSAPVVIAFIEGVRNRSLRFVIIPSLVIFLGLILINAEAFTSYSADSRAAYLLGIFYGILSLGAWVWYVIFNARFLSKNPLANPSNWTILMGIMTFIFTIVGIVIRYSVIEDVYIEQTLATNLIPKLLLIVFILGSLSTWLAYTLWNNASAKLSATLCGQIAILETVFSLSIIYIYQQTWPTFLEYGGIFLILFGIWKALSASNRIHIKTD